MFDRLFGRRRLSPEAKRKLLVIAARSEENIVETHVSNLLDMLDMLGDEVDVDRAIELYQEMLPMDEHVASTVANRVIARHESPEKNRRGGGGGGRGGGTAGDGRHGNVFRDPKRR